MATQLTFLDMEPAMEAIQYVEDMLRRDYQEMLVDIAALEKELSEAGEGVVGSYGDPNAGIRAAFKNSDKTGAEVARREKKWRRLEQMRESIAEFDAAIEALFDRRERTLALLLAVDGLTVKDAARSMRLCRQRVHEIKNSMVRKLAWHIIDSKPKGDAA